MDGGLGKQPNFGSLEDHNVYMVCKYLPLPSLTQKKNLKTSATASQGRDINLLRLQVDL